MLLPVNRCQSPISTASANAGQRGDPAQAAQPAHDRGELAVGGHLGDRLVEAVPAGRGGEYGVVVGLERHRGRRVVESLPAQPRVVHAGPGIAAGVDDPWRSSSFESRCRARIRSPRASSRARTRSRAASCSTLGTATAVTSPSRSSRARCTASLASVLTRSPEGRCSFDGAATTHRIPAAVSARASPNPVGPAS